MHLGLRMMDSGEGNRPDPIGHAVHAVMEDPVMDPHFHEYLAAIAGMHDVYGEKPDDHPTEFHEVSGSEGIVEARPAPAHRVHWDCEPSEEFAGSGAWI